MPIDSSGMLQSADGEPVRAAGDEFVVHMDRESLNDYPLGTYDVTAIITRFERNTLIEWTISGPGAAPDATPLRLPAGARRRWRW